MKDGWKVRLEAGIATAVISRLGSLAGWWGKTGQLTVERPRGLHV